MPTNINYPVVSATAPHEADHKMLRQITDLMLLALFVTTIIVGFAAFGAEHDGATRSTSRADITAYCAEPGVCTNSAAP